MGFVCGKSAEPGKNLFEASFGGRIKIAEDSLLDHLVIGENVVISGGHCPVDINGELVVGKNSIYTMGLAAGYVAELKEQGIDARLAWIIDDLKCGSDARRIAQDDLQMPVEYKEAVTAHGLSEDDFIRWGITGQGPNLGNHYWEQALSNRFNSGNQKTFQRMFPEEAKMVQGGCQKALAQHVLDLHEQEVDTCVCIVPGCSGFNIGKGFMAAKEAMPEINLYALFSTNNCYE
jgi:hypothetical protein